MTQSSPGAGEPARAGRAVLNRRDLLILDCLAKGASTTEIASVLSVSGNTARTKIRRIQRKLQVTDRASAVQAARGLGFLQVALP
jgi:LuxR family maltose regulon positive regulatory protein